MCLDVSHYLLSASCYYQALGAQLEISPLRSVHCHRQMMTKMHESSKTQQKPGSASPLHGKKIVARARKRCRAREARARVEQSPAATVTAERPMESGVGESIGREGGKEKKSILPLYTDHNVAERVRIYF